MRDPIAPVALERALVGTFLVLVAALVGAAVRLLPWALDPTIPWGTLAPFARSLLAVAVEAALLTGWPVGWALASARLIDRGEARVLAATGEAPLQTLRRLAPQAALFMAVLGLTSFMLGRDASAPGHVVRGLLREGRAACEAAVGSAARQTHAVPFVAATWLCAPAPGGPRLVGKAPIGGVLFTAADADVSDDLRRIDLHDARLTLGNQAAKPENLAIRVHVGSLRLQGLTPFAQASSLPPVMRALIVTSAGLLAAAVAALALLWFRERRIGSVAAVAIGAAGPLAALGTLRALEVRVAERGAGAWLAVFLLVPLVAALAPLAAAAVAALLPVARRSVTK